MAIEDWVRRGHPVLFGAILVFSIIELAISAWLVSRYNAHRNYNTISQRDQVRFTLFCSIWTILGSSLFIGFFLLAADSILASVASHLVFLIVTWIFWLAAAASVSASIGGGLNCSTQDKFVYCGQLNALIAFGWIIWILLTFALVVAIIRGIVAARRGDGHAGALVA